MQEEPSGLCGRHNCCWMSCFSLELSRSCLRQDIRFNHWMDLTAGPADCTHLKCSLRQNLLWTPTLVGFTRTHVCACNSFVQAINPAWKSSGAGIVCKLIIAKHPKLAKLSLSYWHIKRQLCIKKMNVGDARRPPTPVDFQTSPSNPSPAAAEVAGPKTAGPLHLEHMLPILLLHILCQKVTITCLRIFSLR